MKKRNIAFFALLIMTFVYFLFKIASISNQYQIVDLKEELSEQSIEIETLRDEAAINYDRGRMLDAREEAIYYISQQEEETNEEN